MCYAPTGCRSERAGAQRASSTRHADHDFHWPDQGLYATRQRTPQGVHRELLEHYRAYTAKAGAASRRAQVSKTIGTVLVGVVVSLVTAPLIADGLSALMRLGLAGLFAVALVCATVLAWKKFSILCFYYIFLGSLQCGTVPSFRLRERVYGTGVRHTRRARCGVIRGRRGALKVPDPRTVHPLSPCDRQVLLARQRPGTPPGWELSWRK